MVETLKNMKESLVYAVQGQLGRLDQADTKELGEAIDMIKDLEEAIYYCTVVKAMEEKDKEAEKMQMPQYYTPMRWSDKPYYDDRMYYGGNGGGSSSNGSGNSNGSNGSYYGGQMMVERNVGRDMREGRSPAIRRHYMEGQSKHQPKEMQMQELENYMQELSMDLTEMIKDASPEEKAALQNKLSLLATKIK